ncbi:DNA-3-methyladenine glycosylase family protein [Sphingomicrobium astaxanthinifaciens]|uniref:DNA-3-methyladenine glycosylase family protein n=1 Tax=Sphingomicrobium astaxanthinifaciens TaxID=1227949 RepID=UPI001FCBD772|nr:DNA-3-methyladenine glycosylase 2 family protein [Sphingomicrobium astaxanthinifaciens]MCJ7421554.1 DNA-3-methyladenine glycosylase 2 family protein [Sphingomicrobium astaxanthinifaciens]
MVQTQASLDAHLDALAAIEPAFAAVIETHGRPAPRVRPCTHVTMLRTIVGQQVSVAAADSMWRKLADRFGEDPDLEAMMVADDDAMRAAGLSSQKAGYARSLARLVHEGEVDFRHLPEDDEAAIAELTRIKGIGRWSAEIYLLFSEGRPDVFPAGDLAVQVELAKILKRPERPPEKLVRQWAEPWSPHRGAAAILAWHSYMVPPM